MNCKTLDALLSSTQETVIPLSHHTLTLQSPTHTNISLRRFLTKHLGLPVSLIHRLVRARKITFQEDSAAPESVPDLALRLDRGNILHIRDPSVVIREAWQSSSVADEAAMSRQPSLHVPKTARDKIRSWVVYEDELVVVVNKPSGVAVHGGTGQTSAWSTLSSLALALASPSSPHPPLPVHRIDKSTSGLVMLAKTRAAADLLASAMRQRTLPKTYLAVTAAFPSTSALDRPEPPAARPTQYGTTPKDARVMHERTVVATSTTPVPTDETNKVKVKLKPVTGRKHQLRAVMHQVLKCPIVGDYKYGYRDQGRGRKLHLHLWKVELPWGADGKPGTTVVMGDVPEYVVETLKAGNVSVAGISGKRVEQGRTSQKEQRAPKPTTNRVRQG
ncbi:pseudouridine synthase [Catenaria anguillulae PL171]|uniref:Pseudouridine synthase n=1 Tax=Catenaria anguillulae PL171 TaxID=765915 RepID=A0A1Y2I6D7_9FUNG|nr:pseudouridine synthase [Catenaria anguillulae PL171]